MTTKKRRVLITGAAKRIGEQLARSFANAGYDLVLHANRSVDPLERLAKEIRQKSNVDVALGACDFSNRAATQQFADHIFAEHRIDVLINNASLFQEDRLPDVTDQCFDTHMNVNFHAPRLLMTQMVDTCKTQAFEGHVINVLDHKLHRLNPDYFSYTISKAALGTMTKACAMQFAPHCRVNSISPGIALVSGKQSHNEFEESWSSPPMGRSATPGQIADAALFLDRTQAIHGQDIVIDGGQTLYHLPRDIAFLPKNPRVC